MKATLAGITNHYDNLDASADLFRTVFLPNMRHFGLTEGLSMKIVRRGVPPQGGGLVVFECPIIKTMSPIQLLDDGAQELPLFFLFFLFFFFFFFFLFWCR